MTTPRDLKELTERLIAEGKLIEAGFVRLRIATIPLDAPQIQIDTMWNAFLAGALHVFGVIVTPPDPGEEQTEADMRRLSQIGDELKAFIGDFERRNLKTTGNA